MIEAYEDQNFDKILRRLATLSSSNFFERICEDLSSELGWDYAFIVKFKSQSRRVESLAIFGEGRKLPPISYSLDGHVCSEVLHDAYCEVEAGLWGQYPNDEIAQALKIEAYAGALIRDLDQKPKGILVLCHKKPRKIGSSTRKILEVCAVRIGAEMLRRETEKRYQRMASEYQIIFDNVPAFIFIKDSKNNVLHCNRAAADRVNMRVDDIVGKNARDFCGDFADTYLQDDLEVLRTWQPKLGILEKVETENSHCFWVRTDKIPFKDPSTQEDRVLVFCQDVTEQVKAEQEAVAASKMKSNFIANVSHEIRTPMNGVLGMVDLLLNTDLNSDQKGFALTIEKSASTLLSVINDILDFSSIESGALTIREKKFDIYKLLDETISLMTPMAMTKKINLVAVGVAEGASCYVTGDEARIRQVLYNIIGNAIKFTDEGVVEVCLDLRPGQAEHQVIRVSVRDTGPGVAKENQTKIFEAFSQCENESGQSSSGTGLGLSICKELVELMGGQIGLESEKGEGSTFWFEIELPLAQVGDEATQKIKVKSNNKKRSDVSILVAEDNRINQMVILKMLSRYGYKAKAVNNGKEVLAEIDSGKRYDAILMDCRMPVLDGYEASRAIRIRESQKIAQPKVFIVAITAHAMKGDRERCMSVGCDAYLAKPIRSSELIPLLDRRFVLSTATEGSDGRKPTGSVDQLELDSSAIESLRSTFNESEEFEDFVSLFSLNFSKSLAALEKALSQRDSKGLAAQAHQLTSSCLVFGANRAGNILKDIEKLAITADFETVEKKLLQLKSSFASILKELALIKSEFPKSTHGKSLEKNLGQ